MQQKPLGQIAIGGMTLTAIGIALSKLASFGSQFALGWLLTKEDFALYAIAISWSTLVTTLRSGRTDQILVQRGSAYAELASSVLKIGLSINVVGFLILCLIAQGLSHIHDNAVLLQLVLIVGASLPLSTLALLFQAKLSIDLKFLTITKLTTCSSILRQGSMVGFALLGLGPLSFVLPLLVVAMFETIAGYIAVGSFPPKRKIDQGQVKTILGPAGWVMLGSLGSSLIMFGDYLVIGQLHGKPILGVYFFGSQLTLSIAILVATGLHSVMMPILSSLSSQETRQVSAFLRAWRVLAIAGTFVAFIWMIGAPPLMQWLWNHKWDDAIPVVQLLSLSLIMRMIDPLGRSLLQAQSRWKFVALLSIGEGAGLLLAAAIGAVAGGLFTIAVSVSLYWFLFGFLQVGLLTKMTGIPSPHLFVPLLSSVGIGLLAIGGSVLVGQYALSTSSGLIQAAVSLAVFGLIYAVLISQFCKVGATELRALLPRGFRVGAEGH